MMLVSLEVDKAWLVSEGDSLRGEIESDTHSPIAFAVNPPVLDSIISTSGCKGS